MRDYIPLRGDYNPILDQVAYVIEGSVMGSIVLPEQPRGTIENVTKTHSSSPPEIGDRVT